MDQNPIVVLGCGPAGMAAALALVKVGHKVVIYERYREARPAGNILNLWPPPVKALKDMGVDIDDIGAPCETLYHNATGHLRCEVRIPKEVQAEYGAGFIGLLRPDLYSRMLDALPAGTVRWNAQVSGIQDHGDHVTLQFADGSTVDTPLLIGCDGIDSIVRRHLWGPQEKRIHNLLIVGGYTFDTSVIDEKSVVALHHSRDVQGTWSSIRSKGRQGLQWWFVQGRPDHLAVPSDLRAHVLELGKAFPERLSEIVRKTPAENMQTWKIRDLVPIKKWSKGRITLAGDAAHAISPYAAYGAGMSICDGYFLGQVLLGVDLHDTAAVKAALDKYDGLRIAHTSEQVTTAHFLGQLFHHTPWYLQAARDMVLDYTPFLQWEVGDRNPKAIIEQLKEMGEDILHPKAIAI